MVTPSPSLLSIGFVLMPDFTMLALAGFVDTLRLAGDEGDRSRQVECHWTVMTSDGGHVTASNGIRVTPDSGLVDPSAFDYLVVVGGTMHREGPTVPALSAYLVHAAHLRVKLVGICTGGFVLARAGLMEGRQCCVSWFHRKELELEFPEMEVIADRLFVIDRDRITCAGGTSVIHLASHLVEQHLGSGRSSKGLRVMLEERAKDATSSQPLPSMLAMEKVADARVRRAVLIIDHHLATPRSVAAIARDCGITARQLHRLFVSTLGTPPGRFSSELRVARARELLETTALPLTQIAFRCGFADAAHLSRSVKRSTGHSPTTVRAIASA